MAEHWESGETRRLEALWEREARVEGIERSYSPEDVIRLRNSFPIRYTLAERGA